MKTKALASEKLQRRLAHDSLRGGAGDNVRQLGVR